MMRASVLAGILLFVCRQAANASYCQPREYMLDEISKAPVLTVVRVISVQMTNGPHFIGNPKLSAPAQEMTAEAEVLRSLPSGAMPHTVKIRFTGRDGPDFSWCSEGLPELPVGQVLLLPLSGNAEIANEPWRLIGTVGYSMTTRVAAEMRIPEFATKEPRSFIIHELVNSLSSADSMARYTAALLLARQAHYLNPELTSELQQSLQSDQLKWGRLLGSIFLSFSTAPSLNVSDVNSPRQDWGDTHFQSLPLARLALSHLPATNAEAPVWHSIMQDVPALADDPYHPLFAYSASSALHVAYWCLLPYLRDSEFIAQLRSALQKDQPGSLWLAWLMIDQGQPAFLPEALDRAMKVITRPGANGDDIVASVTLISKYGSETQRDERSRIAGGFRLSYPDFAAYLEVH